MRLMSEMTAYAAVVSLKQRIEAVSSSFDVLLPPPILEIFRFAFKELQFFLAFLESLDSSSRKRMNASLRLIAEATRIFDLAFQYHYSKLNFNGVEFQMISTELLEHLKQDTHSFIETLKKMEEVYYEDEEAVSSSSGVVDLAGNKSKMVGLSDVYSKLKEELVGVLIRNLVFSIFGMTGIGKTTLARKIFKDVDIMEWFECRVWVQLGRKYQLEEITEAVLAQVDPGAHKMLMGARYEEVAEYLKESLKGKRYLIVLDDVWYMGNQKLESLFPNNENGNRVLLTTTNYLVAHQFKSSTHLLELRLMNEEESWDLLRDKVFGEDSCPPQLERAGKKIAEKCDGLPLTIIIVANLLSKAEKTPGPL